MLCARIGEADYYDYNRFCMHSILDENAIWCMRRDLLDKNGPSYNNNSTATAEATSIGWEALDERIQLCGHSRLFKSVTCTLAIRIQTAQNSHTLPCMATGRPNADGQMALCSPPCMCAFVDFYGNNAKIMSVGTTSTDTRRCIERHIALFLFYRQAYDEACGVSAKV